MPKEPDRIALARLPTPLEALHFDWKGRAHRLWVKRDDLTGTVISGNKIRKLEYLLCDAKNRGAQRVLTCGGLQSNHCRATAVAAARLGLQSTVYLRVRQPERLASPPSGNWRICAQVGADIRFVTPEDYAERDALMANDAGPNDVVIPEGGSNALGAWGYIRAVDEMSEQWQEPPTSIVCAVGSGGTLAGLLMGVARRGLQIPVFGVCVCDDRDTFQTIVARITQDAHGLWPALAPIPAEEVSIVEGYVGRGYALSTPEESQDIATIARTTGTFLDPVYTGKAFRALLCEPELFGPRPLFVHTGGIFGLLA